MSRNDDKPPLHVTDWISRQTVPDLYPRLYDPFRPGSVDTPYGAPAVADLELQQRSQIEDIYQGWITTPGQRPQVQQNGFNYQLSVGTSPIPLANQRTICETIVLDVFNGVAQSVFFGYGSGITVSSGIEVRPGLPIAISTDNTREQWELQRMLETIASLLAADRGFQPPGIFRAPRVVFDANSIYVVAAATTALSVMLFLPPEMQ